MTQPVPGTPRIETMPVLSPSGFSNLVWYEWGPRDAARVVLCVHGLTRNGRDFEVLATALAAAGMRVASVDMPGRGRSDRLRNPKDYNYPVYGSIVAALIARLGAPQIDYVGTSMGGVIGMGLAAQPGSPLRRLVVNDVGQFIPGASLARIARYIAQDEVTFSDLAGAESYLRRAHALFGALTDAQWAHMAEHGVTRGSDGRLRLGYDPAIGREFAAGPLADVAFWPIWEAVVIPVLVLRGAESDLLLADTAQEMTRRGAAAAKGLVQLREIAGAGHAPALMADDQAALVRDFLAAP